MIEVRADNWLQNVKTGEIKLAKDLTKTEQKKEEWRVVTRKERRKMKFKGATA